MTSYYNRASYEPLLIDGDYSEDLRGSSLSAVLETGLPRIIADLEQYLEETRAAARHGSSSRKACAPT